jgi:NAD(P)H-dependent nitrite reductase small subunit
MSWEPVCPISDIPPNAGVAAMINGKQIAVFQVEDALYAVDNYDPLSKVNSLSRGIVGCINKELYIASPLYKQHFSLTTGQCLEESNVKISTYTLRCSNGVVEIDNGDIS